MHSPKQRRTISTGLVVIAIFLGAASPLVLALKQCVDELPAWSVWLAFCCAFCALVLVGVEKLVFESNSSAIQVGLLKDANGRFLGTCSQKT
jgi:hypothetical protein